MKKIVIGIGLGALAYGLLVGLCFFFDVQIGPPLYERDSKEYLRTHGFGADVAAALLTGAPMDHETVVALTKTPDISVRHMLGRNRHLSADERLVLFQDENEFVRQGVALNPALSREEIQQAMSDSSHYVQEALAMNAAVPVDMLMPLRNRLHVGLVHFAQNENCPDELVREIETSEDPEAKELLHIHGRGLAR